MSKPINIKPLMVMYNNNDDINKIKIIINQNKNNIKKIRIEICDIYYDTIKYIKRL